MITFQTEPGYPFLNEAFVLFEQHYAELAQTPDIIKYKPNLKFYEKLYYANKLEIHTVRDGEKLVGYNIWFLVHYLHAMEGITADSDILFLHPDYRKGITGFKFLKWSTDEIKKRNPQRILMHATTTLDYGRLLERLGAKCYEKVYMILAE